jgi:homoserine kinase
MKSIRVFAPATVANVACGFDIFGFALDRPGDEIEAYFVPDAKRSVSIKAIYGDDGKLSCDPQKNSATVSAKALLDHLGINDSLELILKKQMAIGSGLGSSSASAAAAVFAVNALCSFPLSAKELIPFAMEGEKIASGSAHADNVAPCLLGGFTLIRSYNPLDIVQIPISFPLFCTVLHPHIEVLTKEARAVLPKEIPLSQHVAQSGNACAAVAALFLGDKDLLSRALVDEIAEPRRKAFIPRFDAIKQAAFAESAIACSLSGSGPAIFALSSSQDEAERIGKAMAEAYGRKDYSLFLSPINTKGPYVL